MGITIYSCERRKRQPSFATKNTCSNVLILGDQSRQVVQICSQRVRQVAKKREMLGSPSRNSYVNRCNSLEDPTQTITCRPRHHDLQSPKEASVTHVGKKPYCRILRLVITRFLILANDRSIYYQYTWIHPTMLDHQLSLGKNPPSYS